MAKVRFAPIIIAAKTVAVAGTAEPLSASPAEYENIMIQASRNNIGLVYIGDSSVGAANGLALQPGELVSYAADTSEGDSDYGVIDLTDVYVDADNSGDSVIIQSLSEVARSYNN